MVLLLDGADGSDEECIDALTGPTSEETAVLFVSFVESPTQRRDFWHDRKDEAPSAMTVVYVSPRAEDVVEDSLDDVSIHTVTHPSNLTRLGVEITRALDQLQDESEGAQIVVCFQSISALLQYADVRQVFQFLLVLRDQFREVDAAVHAHLDVEGYDERTVATLQWVFDSVVE